MKEFVWTDELVKEFHKLYTQSCWGKSVSDTIEMFKEQKKPKPLFTTTDGVDIWDNKTIVYVPTTPVGKAHSYKAHFYSPLIKFNIPCFSTEEAAKDWSLLNTKVLSIQDVYSMLESNDWDKAICNLIKKELIQKIENSKSLI